MAALNQSETESLSLACTVMQDAASRLKRAKNDEIGGFIELNLAEVDFIIESLTKATRQVNTVKQMKGYYPK
jgi:hypothetical protein